MRQLRSDFTTLTDLGIFYWFTTYNITEHLDQKLKEVPKGQLETCYH
jgi:hypothetical protein